VFNNKPIELISLSVKLSKHHCSKKLLPNGIGLQLDGKESLEQPYLEQQTKALLPNKELYYLGKKPHCAGKLNLGYTIDDY